jgi:hypothetical protein
LPIVLLLFRQDELTLSPDQRQRALDMLLSWLVRRMLCKLTTKNYNRIFLDVIRKLTTDPSSADSILLDELRSSNAPSGVWPSDDQVRDVLENSATYGQISQPRIVMVLGEVERAIRSNMSENLALPPGMTIEHVLPRQWSESWPVDPNDDGALAADRERHVNRIGNLTLVTNKLNPSMSNGPWTGKRPALNEHSVLLLNRRIVDEHPDSWDEADVDRRSGQLVDHILTIWSGPQASTWS